MKVEINQLADQSTQYRLKNSRGIEVDILSKGGQIQRLLVPDRNGHQEDILLGNLKSSSLENSLFNGLSGHLYDLSVSSMPCETNLSFHLIPFTGEAFTTTHRIGVRLCTTIFINIHVIHIEILYILTNDNQLILRYFAKTKQPLRLSLSNLIFFNLSGNLKESISQHDLKFSSSYFLNPTYALLNDSWFMRTKGTVFDFQLGRRLKHLFIDETTPASLTDTYFLFCQKPVIAVHEALSGRWMTIESSQPGFLLSTAWIPSIEAGEQRTKSVSGVCFDLKPFILSSLVNQRSPYSQHTTYSFSTTY